MNVSPECPRRALALCTATAVENDGIFALVKPPSVLLKDPECRAELASDRVLVRRHCVELVGIDFRAQGRPPFAVQGLTYRVIDVRMAVSTVDDVRQTAAFVRSDTFDQPS